MTKAMAMEYSRKSIRINAVAPGGMMTNIGVDMTMPEGVEYDLIQREAFNDLDAPVLRVTQADVPMPYNKHLEKAAKVDPARIVAAVRSVLYRD